MCGGYGDGDPAIGSGSDGVSSVVVGSSDGVVISGCVSEQSAGHDSNDSGRSISTDEPEAGVEQSVGYDTIGAVNIDGVADSVYEQQSVGG